MNNKIVSALGLSAALAFGAQLALADDHRKVEGAAQHDSEQPVGDTWITTKVKTTLLATDGVAGTDINVSTTNGVVTLAGVLDNQSAVARAIEVTRGIEGVIDVDSRALTSRDRS